ncbi:MAG: hypothetical protein GWP06_00955 [Actinobacteria bacterium]|nr:hypothetical protein [Actinomycetota bacterium]
MKKIWTEKYRIHSYEVDLRASATLPVLCQFMQESAWRHAENMGFGFSYLKDQDFVWVLARQVVKMNAFPKWGDTIKIETQPLGVEKLLFFREFRLSDENGNSLGYAATAWFIMDLKKRRPKRPDKYFGDHLNKLGLGTFEKPARLEADDALDYSEKIKVSYSDLDVNEHVNNVRYLGWMLDALPLDFLKSHFIREMEINYLAEAQYGEDLQVGYCEHEELLLTHAVRNGQEKTLCRARTKWQEEKA